MQPSLEQDALHVRASSHFKADLGKTAQKKSQERILEDQNMKRDRSGACA